MGCFGGWELYKYWKENGLCWLRAPQQCHQVDSNYKQMCVCAYVCAYVGVYVCVYVCVCVHACVCVCVCVCAYVRARARVRVCSYRPNL